MAALGYVYDANNGYYQHPDLADSSLELLVYTGNTYKKNTAVLLEKQFSEQGIRVRLKQTDDFNAYRAAVETGEFDLYIGEVKLYNNMDLSPFWEGGALSFSSGPERTPFAELPGLQIQQERRRQF